jgi:dsDNA-specific endonuclease/ATPase MutS2
MTEQPEPLRLADALSGVMYSADDVVKAAAELRWLHREVERLRGALERIARGLPVTMSQVESYARLAVEQATAELRAEVDALKRRLGQHDACNGVMGESGYVPECISMRAEVERLREDAERWQFVRRHSWKELQRARVLAGIKAESVLGQNWEDAIDDLLEAAGTTEQAIAARTALKEPK